jgi:membrane-bound lytic murein transglycosylase D
MCDIRRQERSPLSTKEVAVAAVACKSVSTQVAAVKRLALVTLAAISLSACAHIGRPADASDPNSSVQAGAKAVDPQPPGNSPTAGMNENAGTADLSDSGADLKAIPLAVNRQVLKWIDYFQGQGRPHMERYLSRSSRYMPVMKSILHDQGLPEDLIYIALIESGFSSTAKSSAQAVGYWQFIRGTGKHYGLKVDSYVDERRDFIRSTQAAAAYFKDLYSLFHGWYLAVASYNVGENRVKKLVDKYHTRDFWQLARENKLPVETSDYVPKFIAARLIAKSPEKYGFTDIDYMSPVEFDEAEFSTSIDLRKLAKEMNLEYDDLRDLNPSYKRGVAFEKAGKLSLRVPKGTKDLALAGAANAAAGSKKVYVADEDYSYYKIRRGDTIATIARKFNTTQRNIRSLNKLGSGARLVAGKRLRVPAENIADLTEGEKGTSKKGTKMPSSAPSLDIESAKGDLAKSLKRVPANQKIERKTKAMLNTRRIHIVKKGDTLVEIARLYQVSLMKLATFNKISRRTKIVVGTRLEIPQ